MNLKSNVEWKKWGRDDPLWAVCTEPGRQRNAANAWTDQDFYATGRSDWHDFLPQWQQVGIDTDSCLEIGCGAGRMTAQLSSTFTRVYAVDVSEHMIDSARRRLALVNVSYEVIDGLVLPLPDRSVKAIFSTHVMQHLDSADIVTDYFREMFRVLDSGGSIMIHVPLTDWSGTGRIAAVLRFAHGCLLAMSDLKALLLRNVGFNLMRWTAVSCTSFYESLRRIGFVDVHFRVFATSRENRLYSFVMARK